MAYHLGKVEGIEESMATKARLHWFWRGAIAAALGGACLAGVAYLDGASGLPIARLLSLLDGILPKVAYMTLSTVVWGLFPSLGALLGYGLLTHWLGDGHADGELHCRRCDHILRGLSEPRCPECGEVI